MAAKRSTASASVRLPFGYRVAEDGATLVADLNEQRIIHRVHRTCDDGRTVDSIAA